ncbi:hypothetical protein OAN13_05330 [Opitutales bacterium]|nr:hypothetical protein [Opitutales bacterium]
MITTIESLFSPSFLFTIWAIFLAIGLYLGVFRSMIDRIRAGISTPPGEGSRSGKLLESMLREPNHARPLHVESALFSALQVFVGFFSVLIIWTGESTLLGGFVAFFVALCTERIFSGIFPRLLTSGSNSHLHLKIGFPFTLFARFLALPFTPLLLRIEKVFFRHRPKRRKWR